MRHLSVSVFLVSAVFSQLPPPPQCAKPLAFGKTCPTAKPSIRYHFDTKTNLCMAFKYKGCGGNKNNFESEGMCTDSCLPMGGGRCPVATKTMTNAKGEDMYCKEDKDCPTTGYCMRRLTGSGLCCRKAVRAKLDSDYAPKCAAGRSVVKVDDTILIGKNCTSNFCPNKANCKKGNYFATCCGAKK